MKKPLQLTLALMMLPLLLIAGTLAYFWAAPAQTLNLAQTLTSRYSPYELELKAPQLSWSPFSFTTELLLLRQKNTDTLPVMSVQALTLEMPLWELIAGGVSTGSLRARNVSYYLNDAASDEPLDLEALFAPLSRLPAEVAIDSVHLISQDANLWVFPLNQLRATRGVDGRLEAQGEAGFGERRVMLQAIADWQTLADGSHRLALDGRMADALGGSALLLDGSVDAAGAALNYQFSVHGEYANVSDFVRALDSEAYPFAGNLMVDGELEGDLNRYKLAISELTLTTDDAYTFSASGTVSHEDAGAIVLDLQARGDARQLDVLLPVPAELAKMLERSEISLRILGTLNEPRIAETGLSLYGPGDTVIALRSDELALTLEELRTQTITDALSGRFSLRSRDLTQILSEDAQRNLGNAPLAAVIDGTLGGTSAHIALTAETLTLEHPQYQLQGNASLLWADTQLSAPALQMTIRERNGNGELAVTGTIADLAELLGVALQLDYRELNGDQLLALAGVSTPAPVRDINGSALLLRAAQPWQLRDISLQLRKGDFLAAAAGNATIDGGMPSADLSYEVSEVSADAWTRLSGLRGDLKSFSGQLRLRPRYATALSTIVLGESTLQSTLSAEFEQASITELGLDLYSPSLRLEDFGVADAPDAAQEQATNDTPMNLTTLRNQLPGFPVHVTLRAEELRGASTRLDKLSVAVDGNAGQFLLTHLDARYAGGEMLLRGALDLAETPASFSLAGEGIRIPLGALTEDLGLQQEVRGLLSLRGGVSSQSTDGLEWLAGLNGHAALALTDTTISGAAYDLLMTNLLAWLVRGVNAKTTTFDCVMAEFDIRSGAAQSDTLYMETSRMLATGKARIDPGADTIDLRLEPRSKTRTLQFPSAVHIEGALSDPRIRVSPLQTTADLSAQALMLLPSLTLKLFGVGGNDAALRPCEARKTPQ